MKNIIWKGDIEELTNNGLLEILNQKIIYK